MRGMLAIIKKLRVPRLEQTHDLFGGQVFPRCAEAIDNSPLKCLALLDEWRHLLQALEW